MKKGASVALLALAATLAPASCRCSGTDEHAATTGGTAETTSKPTLAAQSFKLQNGLQVDLVSGPCGDSAALAVLVGVGVEHDPPGRSGLVRLAGRVLATPADGRAMRTVETGSTSTLYSLVVPGDRIAAELDDVAAWMAKVPTDEDLTRERPAMLEDLAKREGSDAALTATTLAEEAVRPAGGDGKRYGVAKEVEAITAADLQGFWDAHVKPGNARIVVTGRFDPEKVRAHIEKVLGPLPAGTAPAAREAGGATVRGTLVMGETPSAVAIAVPAPAANDALYPAFLVMAARLVEKPAEGRTWEASYDPLARPEVLLVTGPVGKTEQPEPAAARMRTEVAAIVERPLAPEDAAKARQRFRLFLEPELVDPELCAEDARAFAAARARRAGAEASSVAQALDAVTKEQLDDAAQLFGPKRSAAVIAGGAIR